MNIEYWESCGRNHAATSMCPEIITFNQGSSWYRLEGFEHMSDGECAAFARGFDEARRALYKTATTIDVPFDPAELMDTVANIQAIIKRATTQKGGAL